MDDGKRVYWSVEKCAWVDCPTPPEDVSLPQQRADEPEPVVLAES